jgi:hypothetical protein
MKFIRTCRKRVRSFKEPLFRRQVMLYVHVGLYYLCLVCEMNDEISIRELHARLV